MKRFLGLMPSDEVTIERVFVDFTKHKVLIQAGPKGWTVIYADNSCEYKDVDATAEDNFDAAYRVATDAVGHLTALCK